MSKLTADLFDLSEEILKNGTIGYGLVAERPPGWEYLLFTLALRDGISYAQGKLGSLESGQAFKASTFPVQSISYATILAKQRVDELHRILSAITNIDSELQVAFGEPGKSGDAKLLLGVASKIIHCYIGLVLWRGGISKISACGQVIGYMDMLSDIPSKQIMVIEEFCESGYKRIDDYLKQRLSGQEPNDILLSLKIPGLDLSCLDLYHNLSSTEKTVHNKQCTDKYDFPLNFRKSILKEGSIGDDLVTKRPPGWGYLFFSWTLQEGILYAKNRLDFLVSKQDFKPSAFPIQSMSYATIIAKKRLDELDVVLSLLRRGIDVELEVAIGASVKSGSPDLVFGVASRIIDCYLKIVFWRHSISKISAYGKVIRYMEILRDIPCEQIIVIEEFCETLYSKVDNHIKRSPSEEPSNEFVFNLSIPVIDKAALESYRLENAPSFEVSESASSVSHSDVRKTLNKTRDCVDNQYDQYSIERDNFEKFNFYSSIALEAIGNYRINYTDQRGLNTIRDIRVKRVHKDGDSYAVDAHCMLRGAHRSFINDRINEAINLETGEIIHSLALDAIDQYNNSDKAKAISIIDDEWGGICVLLFVACSDGRLTRPEKVIIKDYIKNRNPSFDPCGLQDDRYINRHLAASHIEFRRIVSELATSGESKKLEDIYFAAKKIVETGSKVDPMERAALDIIDSALKKSIK